MNTDPQTITPDAPISPPGDSPEAPPDPSRQNDAAAADLSGQSDAGADLSRRSQAKAEEERETHSSRRNGNVARLPKAVRDRINVMIQDGVPYTRIIERLGEDGKTLCISSLSRWKDGGYQDWVLEQNWLAETRAKQESASDVAADFDASPVNHAALQLGVLHIYDALRKLGPTGSLDEKLGGNSAAFARLIHALARASRETLQLQKYRESCAKARVAIQNLRDPKHKLTEDERRSLVLMVNDILGLPRREAGEVQSPQEVQSPMSKVQSQEGCGAMTNDQIPINLRTDH